MKTKAQISYNLSQVKSDGTTIEKTLGAALWAAGVRYRKQYKSVPGRPDFAVVARKVAIFCDSSFWHGRDWANAAHAFKSNQAFWITKIEGNIRRDKIVNLQLKGMGWKVARFWDDEIIGSADKCVAAVLILLTDKRWKKNDENCSN